MNSEFEINAYTATLEKSEKINNLHILNNGMWRIPVYQRPYSWGESEITRFIRDMFKNFKDETGKSNPMFIGTMQISESKSGARDVIDGQQRLTTFLLIFHVINLITRSKENLIQTNWLESKVNRGEAQAALVSALEKDVDELESELKINRYAQNLKLIQEVFKEYNLPSSEVKDFRKYILESVYFVCIETKASLSKTLQIFEAINATGMDLNAGDLFKVNFYDYLTAKKNENEEIFESISGLYSKIDIANKRRRKLHKYNGYSETI